MESIQSQQPPSPMTDSELDEISELLETLSSRGDGADSPRNIWMGLSPLNQNMINNHGHSRNQGPPDPGATLPYLNSNGHNRRGGGDAAAANASCEGCLNLEVNLDANKFEILFLTEDNNTKEAKISELLTKVHDLEGKIKANQDEMEELRMYNLRLEEDGDSRNFGQRTQNDPNSLLEKLYSVAGTVLKGLGGIVPPLDLILEEEGINFSLNPKSVETLCHDLHSKFVVWQENHKMMHAELEKTLKIVETLEVEVDSQVNQAVPEPPLLSGSSSPFQEDSNPDNDEEPLCSIFATFSLSDPGSIISSGHIDGERALRRNPLRKCRLGTGSYNIKSACKDHLPGVFEIACDNCDGAFSRLTNVTSKLTRNQTRRNAQVTPRPDIQAMTASSCKNMGRISPNSIRKAKRCHDASTNTGGSSHRRPPPQRPKMIVMDSSGQEHKYAGFYMTILPSEQIRSLLEGIPPTKKRRCFCKCGKHYSDFSSIYRHLKFIQKSNNNSNHAFQIGSREM